MHTRKPQKIRRAENWTREEKKLLRSLILEKVDIIDNKCIDKQTNMLKLQTWNKIGERFVAVNSRYRTVREMKVQWKSMKQHLQNQLKKYTSADVILPNQCDSQDTNHSLVSDDFQGLAIDTRRSLETVNTLEIGENQLTDQDDSIVKAKNGMRHKNSLLKFNKTLKELIANCTLEEHQLRMKHMREEHTWKMQKEKEAHALHCENERLQAELLQLDINLRKKKLNGYAS